MKAPPTKAARNRTMPLSSKGWKSLSPEEIKDDGEYTGSMMFSVETLDGPYKIENGNVVMLDKPAESAAVATEAVDEKQSARKKEKKKKKTSDKAVTAEASEAPSAQPETANASATEKPKKRKKRATTEAAASAPQKKPRLSDTAPTVSNPTSDIGTDWEGLGVHPELLTGVLQCGFSSPTPIQKASLPLTIKKQRDVLGAAHTGSGKTLAFGLPILTSLMYRPPEANSGLAALIITPTRELAIQIVRHLRAVLVCVPLAKRPRVESLVGGMSLEKQERVMLLQPGVVVATVGRLAMAMTNSEFPHLANLSESLRFLVVDEADRMTDVAHYSDLAPVVAALERTEKKTGREKRDERLTMLFSATLFEGSATQSKKMTPRALMQKLGLRGVPEEVVLSPQAQVRSKEAQPQPSENSKPKATESLVVNTALPESIALFRSECTDDEKDAYLYDFLFTHEGSTLVFVNTIAVAKRLAATLSMILPPSPTTSVSVLHANLEQKQRLKHLERFQSPTAKIRILVATDVAARGLDLPGMDHVVHYGAPNSLDTFYHRSGRTGRAGRSGIALVLVGGSDDKAFTRVVDAVKATGRKFQNYTPDLRTLSRIMTRTRLAANIHRAESKLRGETQDRQWFAKAAKDADIILDSDDEDAPSKKRRRAGDDEEDDGQKRRAMKELAYAKSQLAKALAEELVPRGQSRVIVATASEDPKADSSLEKAKAIMERAATFAVRPAVKSKKQHRRKR